MHAVLLLVMAVAANCLAQEQQHEHHQGRPPNDDAFDTDPKTFFDACRAANANSSISGGGCASYKCLSRHHSLDLRQLDHMPCKKNKDCLQEESGFICVKYSDGAHGSSSFCECPKHHAYNATACRCQKALLCDRRTGNGSVTGVDDRRVSSCHNGMRCADDRCSCKDLSRTLFDPQGRFCVQPRLDDSPDPEQDEERNSHERAFWIVLCVIGAFASLAVLAIVVYVCTENVTCARGRYECEDEKDGGADGGEDNHIAAWDMPSLDYLSEEQTMKYLREHERSNASSKQGARSESNDESGSSPSLTPSPQQSGSLPESDRVHGSRQDHVNEGYEYHDADDGRDQRSRESDRTSECVDL